ncbi:MAG TPA: TIM barrel protein [Candidatus Hydrogenedentes bacterium]|nr:TIM barrel protein [Candidatus Hydrogenedentota bacterium]HPG65656.1 TIM barrel protein [Candidatus Hydrogenedentota bacterium]
METNRITRRTAVGMVAGAAGAALMSSGRAAAEETLLKGHLKQSVCKWCYQMSLDDLCMHAAAIGLKGIDLLNPDEWPVAKAHGLICAMANGPSGIARGWNRPQDHDTLVAKSEELLPKVAEAGLPNMIVLSGNRDGLPDDEGVRNCAKGLKRIMPLAEKLGVTVCMELLNSKRDHKDYQCDHTAWGVELVKQIGSDRFKLLYDIYHMQLMEGDIIATIQENIQYIGHFHTGGAPGRNEIDDSQELNYRRIAQAIVDTGFTGYLAQEFIPKRDPVESLRQAAQICDV